MCPSLKDIETLALELSPRERGSLIQRLALSLEGDGSESPAEIAKAWDEGIARREAGLDAGRSQWIPAEEAFAEVDSVIRDHEK